MSRAATSGRRLKTRADWTVPGSGKRRTKIGDIRSMAHGCRHDHACQGGEPALTPANPPFAPRAAAGRCRARHGPALVARVAAGAGRGATERDRASRAGALLRD